MDNTATEGLSRLRLLQLVSPSLPVGAFTYSQGIEWAVEAGWIRDAEDLHAWLRELIAGTLAQLEIPVLVRLYQACVDADREALRYWSRFLLASRETAELRSEERQRGRALATLLVNLNVPRAREWHAELARCQTSCFALACAAWQIPPRDAALGYAWSWLENLVLAAVKLIPLGQTAGQQVLHRLSADLPPAIEQGLTLEDDAIGASTPALAIASSLHETQYTRLFRS
jgi:urease accessory protein